jgi:hypothetical protein
MPGNRLLLRIVKREPVGRRREGKPKEKWINEARPIVCTGIVSQITPEQLAFGFIS